MLRALIVAAALVIPAQAWATDVVIVLGASTMHHRTLQELVQVERRLAKAGARIGIVHAEGADLVTDLELGAGPVEPALRAAEERARVAARRRGLSRSPLSPDLIAAVLDAVKWTPGAQRRLLLVDGQRALAKGGRRTIEEVVFRAERDGVVIHALHTTLGDTLSNRGLYRHSSAARAQRDVEAFLAKPHATLGRVPTQLRHATLQSGGTYHVAIELDATHRLSPRRGEGDSEVDAKAVLDFLTAHVPLDTYYGPRDARGVDALVELANGKRRPSEYRSEELPEALNGVRMEPLLDAVWDYVDARRVFEQLRADLSHFAETSRGADVGSAVAEALLRPRHLPPSRR